MGRRLAELYAGRGNKVGITGRRNELLLEIQQQFPEKIETENFNVTGSENISSIKSLVKKLGGLDVLIYSSGIGEPGKQLNWDSSVPFKFNSFL